MQTLMWDPQLHNTITTCSTLHATPLPPKGMLSSTPPWWVEQLPPHKNTHVLHTNQFDKNIFLINSYKRDMKAWQIIFKDTSEMKIQWLKLQIEC